MAIIADCLGKPNRNLEKDLCLDLSDFNRSSHDFKRFVTELTISNEKNGFSSSNA